MEWTDRIRQVASCHRTGYTGRKGTGPHGKCVGSPLRMLRRCLARLSRFPRSHGFGVQSPFAYHLIRDVLCARVPEDVCSSFEQQQKQSWHMRSLGRLFFRLAQYWHPDIILDMDGSVLPYHQYLVVGCPHVAFHSCPGALPSYAHVKRLVFCSATSNISVDTILSSCDQQSLLIVLDLYQDRFSRSIWEQLMQDQRSGVTFDLYDCGVLFFDLSFYKQNYKTNF